MAEKRQGRHFHFSCFDGLEGHRLKAAALRRLKLRRSLEGCEQQKVALSLSEGTRAEGLWLRSFLPRLLCHHGPWQKGMHKLKFQRTALWNQDATFVGKLATVRKKAESLYFIITCVAFSLGWGWDGIYCGYGVSTALKIVHWSTPFLTIYNIPRWLVLRK